MKRLSQSAIFVLSLLGSGLAFGEVLGPQNDTFVRNDGSGPYGANGSLAVKTSGGSTTRKGYIDFTVSNPATITSAKLSLTVSYFTNGTQATFNVWGLAPSCPLNISEGSAVYSSFVTGGTNILGSSSQEVLNTHACFANNGQALATFTVQNSQLNSIIDVQSTALTNYMKGINGKARFIITRLYSDGGGINTDFASKENASLQGPKLEVTRVHHSPDNNNVLTPTDDTYVQYNGTGPYGSSQDLYVKKAYYQEYARKAYIEFFVPSPWEVDSAHLELTVSKFVSGQPTSTFQVWGLSDVGVLNKNSGMAMDVYAFNESNGAKVVQWPFNGYTNQEIAFWGLGNNEYMLIAIHSQKCLQVENNTSNGAKLQQWDCTGTNNQIFKVEDAGDGYYYIKPKHSNKCLEIGNSSTAQEANVQQWDCNGTNTQQWQINSFCGNSDFSESSLVSTSNFSWHPGAAKKVMGEWNVEAPICSYAGKGKGPLAEFTVSASDLNQKKIISSDALSDYVRNIYTASQPGATTKAIFVVTRKNCCDSNDPAFASDEHPTLQGPRLVLNKGGEPLFEDWASNATQNGDGSWHFDGTMKLPYAGGVMVCTGVSADISFDSNGDISTFDGSMTTPSITFEDTNLNNMFEMLGEIKGDSGEDITYYVGYNYPDHFDTAEMPLDPSKKYFYFVQSSAGESAEWSNISISAGGSTTLFAFDPNTPAIWAYTDKIGDLNDYVNYIAFGMSNEKNIPFIPLTETFVGNYINPFDGNLYVGTSVNVASPIADITNLTIDGEVVVDVDGSLFNTGSNTAFRRLGLNGQLSLNAGIGDFNVALTNLGQVSAIIDKTSDPYVAFSASVTPTNFAGLPDYFSVTGTVAGFVDGDWNDNQISFIKLHGETRFGGKFSNQGLFLTTEIRENGADISGTADFGGFYLNVFGHMDQNHAVFGGSTRTDFDFWIGEIDVDVSASFDTNGSTVSFSSHGEVCIDGDIPEISGCHDLGSSDIDVSLDSLQRIEVCVDLNFLDTMFYNLGVECTTL